MFSFRLLDQLHVEINVDAPRATTALHTAIRARQFEQVETLCRYGENVNAIDDGGYHCLQIAAGVGELAIVEILCQYGAKLKIKNGHGSTALHIATRKNRLDIVKILCDHANKTNSEEKLQSPARVSAPSDLDIGDCFGSTCAHMAIEANNLDAIQMLCAYGANLKIANMYGFDCLRMAVEKNNPALVELLCGYEVDVNATDGRYGRTCLYVAIKNQSIVIIEMLVKFGADCNMLDRLCFTPLYHAIITKDIRIIEILIAHGADVNTIYGGETTLHTAIHQQVSFEIVRELILAKADISIEDSDGETALDLARKLSNEDIIKLIEFGVAPNIKSARKIAR